MIGRSLFKRKRKSSPNEVTTDAVTRSPKHIAIIMDGNNRWAKQRLLPGVGGHRAGVETIRKVLKTCDRFGVEVLTLFAFSSENWLRPESEVRELMQLLDSYLDKEVDELHKQGIRLRFIGRRDRLNIQTVEKMQRAEVLTAGNNGKHLVLAVDYGGQWDIANAAQSIVRSVVAGELTVEQIDESLFDRHIALSDLPRPDLCIRTGGEHRISNFLLWQLSYAELYFSECYWPDFDELQLELAIADFSARQRRFGKTSEQVIAERQP